MISTHSDDTESHGKPYEDTAYFAWFSFPARHTGKSCLFHFHDEIHPACHEMCVVHWVLSPTRQVRRTFDVQNVQGVELARACLPSDPLFEATHMVICGDTDELPLGSASHNRHMFDREYG